jgi:CBS domain containing-hemolysin-like protein
MLLLLLYLFIALFFSFLCSIAEAVLLSLTPSYIALLEQQGRRQGRLLRQLKANIDKPLAAILTLNTVAHTFGAAGVGAQAVAVFGNHFVGIISIILTLLILIFSEIIPKTLGALYWRQLAFPLAYGLHYLIWILHPFVLLSEKLTQQLGGGHTLPQFNRDEFSALIDIGIQEGKLNQQESLILKNLIRLRAILVRDIMTPRTVIFSFPQHLTVADYFREAGEQQSFSRIPVYEVDQENITGFVLRNDLLLAKANQQHDEPIIKFRRELNALPETSSLLKSFEFLLNQREQLAVVVDEYGALEGLVSLEDILETLLGLEIVDESDYTEICAS